MGFFVTDASHFLNSSAINIDTIFGGVQIFIDNQGFIGASLTSPSLGLSSSFTGSDFGLSGTKILFGDELFNFKDILDDLSEKARQLGEELFSPQCDS